MSNNAKMAYLTAFEYGKEDTMEKIKALDTQGVTYIELLVPFSDPVAENPEIQDASLRALQNGCTIEKIFDMLQVQRQPVLPEHGEWRLGGPGGRGAPDRKSVV